MHLRQNCSAEMLIDKSNGKSKGFEFSRVPQHLSEGLIKLNGVEF